MNVHQQRLWQEMLAESFSPHEWWDSEDNGGKKTRPLSRTGGAADNREIKVMWVYQYVSKGRYEVGYWTPDKKWFCDSWYSTQDEAAERVHYLNGGPG